MTSDESKNRSRAGGKPRWLPEFLMLSQKRVRGQARILGLSSLVGFVAGLGAIVFYLATKMVEHATMGSIAGYQPEPHPAGEAPIAWLPAVAGALSPWLLVAVCTVGGLVSGVLVFTLAPEAEGHGTDSVIDAYHRHDGYLRPRVPLVKLVASAITIGSGGSGGREGPIAQIGAGFGSVLGGIVRLNPAERRVLLAAGMGAGIGAIFRAPLAGALFAAEVLYRSPEFESEVILPAALASVIAYSTFASAFGWHPLFAMPDLSFDNPWQLVPYLALAIAMAILAMIYTRTFYGIVAVFHRLPMPRHVRPAVGALATGLVGVALYYLFGSDPKALAVMASGYSAIQGIMREEASGGLALLAAIALGKILTTSLTIGSGGSGGVFGPSIVIGGSGGAALGIALHDACPALVPHPASFAVVGMASFFAAAAKTPFSTLVMVSEMTGGYQLLLPALWGCAISFLVSDEQSIYSAQVEDRSQSPAHQNSKTPRV
jgi:CIC family chloride channel protein